MIRTVKEAIEDKAQIRLSATDGIASWTSRRAAFLQTRFSVGKDGKTTLKRRHQKEYTSQLLPFESLLMRKSETRKLNAANSIPDSFQAFGLEEPQRVMSTLSEQHRVFTHQGQFERRMIWKSGTVASSRV